MNTGAIHTAMNTANNIAGGFPVSDIWLMVGILVLIGGLAIIGSHIRDQINGRR